MGGKRVLILSIAGLVVVLDQLSKILGTTFLTFGKQVVIIDNVFSFNIRYNPGGTWSFATGVPVLLCLFAIVVVFVILRKTKTTTNLWWAWALGVLLGGTLGNLLDRVLRGPNFMQGRVVDFIQVFNGNVFNVADVAIVLSIVTIIVLILCKVPMTKQSSTKQGEKNKMVPDHN